MKKRILLIGATKFEAKYLFKAFNIKENQNRIFTTQYKELTIDIAITGVGIINTMYFLSKLLTIKKYDLVFNFGIAGSYNDKLEKGEIVNVVEEEYADFIYKDKENKILTADEYGLLNKLDYPFVNNKLINKTQLGNIKNVKSITVSTLDYNPLTIAQRKEKFKPDIETMEGAAIFYSCLAEKVKFYQIRSISNYVGEEKKDWEIEKAVEAFSKFYFAVLANYSTTD